MSPQELRSCECERDIASYQCRYHFASTPDNRPRSPDNRPRSPVSTTNYLYVNYVSYDVATRKTISIRDDQEEWIQENHLSLSSFVQEKLDELIEERSE